MLDTFLSPLVLLPSLGMSNTLPFLGKNDDANFRPRAGVYDASLKLQEKLNELGIPIGGSQIQLKTTRSSARFSSSPHKQLIKRTTHAGTVPLETIELGSRYGIDVQVDGETFRLMADTGSSDTWLPSQDLKCFDDKTKEVPQSQCNFTKLTPPTFSGGQIPDRHLNITYDNGNSYLGTVGYEPVSIAGFNVERQVVAKVNIAKQPTTSPGGSHGIFGLGFPNTTSVYPGLDPTKDNASYPNPHNSIPYDPWIISAFKSGVIKKPVFTLVLGPIGGRDGENAGTLIIGGAAPPSSVSYSGNVSSAPLRKYGPPYRNYWWDIVPDGMTIGDQFIPWTEPGADSEPLAYSVDCGSDYSYVPQSTMTPWLKTFSTPTLADSRGYTYALCNATFSSVAVRIGGKDFPFEKSSLLVQPPYGAVDGSPGYCWTGIQPHGSFLGGTFLYGVAATFDMTQGSEKIVFSSVLSQ
ncbi:hypothetical protein COCCADRAFT_40582 [Bipolaris zeicola 26-R-13]|uniref:Peptidase A1 domain-containing protein n=1 Tax=Cochliobolus carbonum (strain 26-R-13) TaxID=930089 RepID=W6XTM1_COCC2|nr:uncharacterized protein COCCADRAFT_40582 [Bipolaris zeicola 26-R-13]EUC28973.1 hypothetical protein COCCADRAFT_40582 [Bipolaris zeicola 26-R-13]